MNGLTVRSKIKGDLHLPNVHVHQSASTMPKCNWLLIGTKATGNAGLVSTIIQAASVGAKIIVLQNGLRIEDELRALLPDHLHLIGGLCYVCLQRTTARRDRTHRCWARAPQYGARLHRPNG